MIHYIWFAIAVFSTVFACVSGGAEEMMQAALDGAEKAILLTFQMAPAYLFFCGLMNIARSVHAEKLLSCLFDPVLKRLMPCLRGREARGAAAMNLALNMLGMGNAATPVGVEAMRLMAMECGERSGVRHDMEMFLILNAAGFQLIPTTVLAMRAAAGSEQINTVIGPSLLCTAVASVVSVALGLLCRRRKGKTDDR